MIAHPMVAINAVPPSVVHADAQVMAAGVWHSMVLKADIVWTTGWNNYGQLGDETIDTKRNFVQVLSGQ